MKIDEYIDLVCKEIKNKRVRSSVSRELYDHLNELKEDYINQGMDPIEAEIKSVRDMGDPKDTGRRLNSIHRRKPEWRLLIISLTIIILGAIFSHMTFPNRSVYSTITNAVVSILVYIIFYFLDYTFLLKYKSEALIAVILIIMMPFIFQLYQRSIWFVLVIILPIIALFKNSDENNTKNSHKESKYIERENNTHSKGIFDEMYNGWARTILLNFPQDSRLWGIVAVIVLISVLNWNIGFSSVQNVYLYAFAFIVFLITIQFKSSSRITPIILYYVFILSYTFFFDEKGMLTPICFIIASTLTYMLYRKWIDLNKKIGLPLIWIPFLVLSYFLIRDYLLDPTGLGSWTKSAYGLNISGEQIKLIIQGAQFIGKGFYQFNFDYLAKEHFIITYIIGHYGLLSGILVIELFLLLIIFLVVNTFKSKHEFGKVISFACTATICVEIVAYILSNLGFFSFPPGFLPFFTGNNISTVLNSICFGLILSIRSNRNIVDEEKIFLKTM